MYNIHEIEALRARIEEQNEVLRQAVIDAAELERKIEIFLEEVDQGKFLPKEA